MEAPGPLEGVRTCAGIRPVGIVFVGVGGACAMCAIAVLTWVMSMLSSVVGFVLVDRAMDLNVCGPLKYELDEREGAGEGGDVGGRGRVEASSSASAG